ncbi:MAG: DUF4037 domain-containing protein [Propionibacteriaceae bacterium]
MQRSGLELAADYYRDVVAGLLADRWPGLPHAAARLGSGSDVLGLDDVVSRDHDFGLRLTLMVERDLVAAVEEYLEERLPETYQGWPTRFATSWDARVRHKVQVDTAEDFAASRLGVPLDRDWDALDWLAVTGQSVLEVTAGAVFADSLGAISAIRRRLRWYPRDVWCQVVATDWRRIGQELPFVGRTGSRGDDLGSAALIGRLVPIAMHLGFLLESRWPPYPKWLGTRFAQLPHASAAGPALAAAQRALTWPERQAAFVEALVTLHEVQRAAGLPTGPDVVESFFDRPFASVKASVSELLLTEVQDPLLRGLPAGVGSVEQWVDNVDVLSFPARRVAVTEAWRSNDARDRAVAHRDQRP